MKQPSKTEVRHVTTYYYIITYISTYYPLQTCEGGCDGTGDKSNDNHYILSQANSYATVAKQL